MLDPALAFVQFPPEFQMLSFWLSMLCSALVFVQFLPKLLIELVLPALDFWEPFFKPLVPSAIISDLTDLVTLELVDARSSFTSI